MAETKTQGMNAYIIESDDTVTDMGCLFEADAVSSPRGQTETTCLSQTDGKTYIAALKDPGDTKWTVKYKAGSAVNAKLKSLWDAGAVVNFGVGLSESTAAPTSTSGTITWPTTRTWVKFTGFIKDVPVSTEKDGIVTCEVAIKLCSAHSIQEQTT